MAFSPKLLQQGASGAGVADPDSTYQISRSLRFNSADTAYLNRTPASATNRKTYTWSGWVKRGLLTTGTYYCLFAAGQVSGGDDGLFYDTTAGGLYFTLDQGNTYVLVTSQVFRDPSAWYHVVVAVDTTQATASNRIKMYVNGVQVTDFSYATYPTQNLDSTYINTTNIHRIGAHTNAGLNFDGYLTEINFIDGQQLTPSSFGETNARTGVWQPKAYSGSYGTNGYKLNFSDNSNTTAGTLGADSSGNGNNWTPNNFSVSAGAGNDSLVDTPTPYGTDTGVGGEVRGNYATFSPLYLNGGGVTASSYTNGNLQIDFSASGGGHGSSTISVSRGKWYSEFTLTAASSAAAYVGIRLASAVNDSSYAPGSTAGSYGYDNSGNKSSSGTATAYGATFTVGDTIGVALDLDAGTLVFYKNGASQGTAYTGISGTFLFAVGDGSTPGTHTFVANFGQRPFAYTAPGGFKALNTRNLPVPTIGATSTTQAGKFFAPVTYTGDGTAYRTITTGLQSDFVWIKKRDTGVSHQLFDAVRGAGRVIYSDTQDAEVNQGAYYVQQFNSDNFFLGLTDSAVNANGGTYVSWVWNAGGSTVNNTAGSLSSQVMANQTAGFSIVTYTASEVTAARTVGHGLGVAPKFMMIRSRSDSDNWYIYHTSIGNTGAVFPNLTNATITNVGYWANTSPTSSVFTVGTIPTTYTTYVAYCFAEVEGYSKFGSYTGNGSADGPFVFTGFRPRFILGKDSGGTNNWFIFDSVRDTYNVAGKILRPNISDAELDSPPRVDLLSNGFKIRSSALPNDATTYIYMAFAESPFKYSLAR
jgi:hypothetical protein